MGCVVLRKPARARRAGAMRQFPITQLDSTSIRILENSKIDYTYIDTKFSTHTMVYTY
jgi:hypothetical protein